MGHFTLFVKNDCPACNLVKERAARAGLLRQIDVRNIETDPDAYDYLMSLGARVVPVLVDPQGGVYVNHNDCLRALGL